MKITDEKAYKKYKKINIKNEDGSSDANFSAIIMFTEKWADIMENKMSNGDRLEDIAEKCAYEANENIGITGLMFIVAIKQLISFWVYKELLYEWCKHSKMEITLNVSRRRT